MLYDFNQHALTLDEARNSSVRFFAMMSAGGSIVLVLTHSNLPTDAEAERLGIQDVYVYVPITAALYDLLEEMHRFVCDGEL